MKKVLVTNLVFGHLKDKYKDSDMFPLFEYLRVVGEMCNELKNSRKFS